MTWEKYDELFHLAAGAIKPNWKEPYSIFEPRLGDGFQFVICGGYNGRLIALDFAGTERWPVKLSEDRLSISLTGKSQFFPNSNKNDHISSLVEEQQPGQHHFHFIVAEDQVIGQIEQLLFEDEQIDPQTLSQIAQILCEVEGVRGLLRLNVKFLPFGWKSNLKKAGERLLPRS